jgi:protein O-mannosyl-transferase
MPAKPAIDFRTNGLAVLTLLAGLAVAWLAYAPGLGASPHFDEQANLGGLANVDDLQSAIRFISTGISGPLGRPVALASFVPQAYAWGATTEVFLRTNILIHLLNGVLVTWFLYLLGHARREPVYRAALVAAGAGAIWMLLPLLASSSLLIVQRMTTLSATFVMLGGIAYLYARRGLDRRPLAALFGMTFAIGAGAVLGALTKENGILLFLFILAVEATLLERPAQIPRPMWRGWFALVLVLPLTVLLYYLVSILSYPEGIIVRRGFNGFERLITQAEILWKYLYLAFLPNVPSLGPYHDDYQVHRSLLNPAALASVAAWIGTMIAAFMLRRKVPLFTFAVAWYLAGHLLESTTVSLELYFEHRNYLPLVGPVYALIASIPNLEESWRRLAIAGSVAYAFVLAIVLFSTTSLWGTPALAAEMWVIHKPDSLRANQYLARNLYAQGDRPAARRLFNRYVERNPDAHDVRLQLLVMSCQLDPDTDLGEEVRQLERQLADVKFAYSAIAAYQQLYELVERDQCPGIDDSGVYRLGESMLANPGFNNPVARHNIHAVMARIGIERRDFALTMSHMEAAIATHPNPETLWLAIGILGSGGRDDIARELFEDAKARPAPRNPFVARQWRQELARMEAILFAMEQSRNQSPSSEATNAR